MGKNVVNGLPARYNTDPIVLNDGDALAFQVNQNGALNLTTIVPTTGVSAGTNVINGNPVRYNENLITLEDGDATAIQSDVNGNTIVVFV